MRKVWGLTVGPYRIALNLTLYKEPTEADHQAVAEMPMALASVPCKCRMCGTGDTVEINHEGLIDLLAEAEMRYGWVTEHGGRALTEARRFRQKYGFWRQGGFVRR